MAHTKQPLIFKLINLFKKNNNKSPDAVIFKKLVPRKLEFFCVWLNDSQKKSFIPHGVSLKQNEILADLSKYQTITKVTVEVLEDV